LKQCSTNTRSPLSKKISIILQQVREAVVKSGVTDSIAVVYPAYNSRYNNQREHRPTHEHFDHILGANAFKNKTSAKIAAHELETEYLENPAKSLTYGETVSADILLKDSDVLMIS